MIRGFEYLASRLEGELVFDNMSRVAYATDASAYRELPRGIAFPRSANDIRTIIAFARAHNLPLIPRAGGTSLAGQVVGNGLVVDVSKHMNRILEVNTSEQWVKVEPGVILDDLNQYLKPLGLFFGPETSTSNRCTIAGMVGNNSCGSHSLIYGSTRDHLVSVKVMLSDESEATLGDIDDFSFAFENRDKSLINSVYKEIYKLLSNRENQKEIRDQYPRPEIKRRNNGYALDALLETDPFLNNGVPLNLSKLIAGSEGTLAFITEIKLHLVPVPPAFKAIVCVHLHSVEEALYANLIALKHHPVAIELMDAVILNCTRDNLSQQRNRFFVQGAPGAILIIEFADQDTDSTLQRAEEAIFALKEARYGYHFPIITGEDIQKVWSLRKAGLGVLSNMKGDAKPVSVVEDTAIYPADLPSFIVEFKSLLDKHSLTAVYHAHIATGELHLRPVLNLKDTEHRKVFRILARETALLVKKYKGSLSGEHGDGRLRGEFIPLMYGEKVCQMFRSVKTLFDPQNIFNPGKIIDSPPMNTFLRYEDGQKIKELNTLFDFSGTHGMMRAIEACNGSGDCRKPVSMGGVMCPSYMVTHDELDSTRGRANVLREFLTRSTQSNPFNHPEIWKVMDLCLSCKGCKSECPSNVDMAKLKAEFLHHYYESNGIPLRTRLITYNSYIQLLGSFYPKFYNKIIKYSFIKNIIGFTTERELPSLSKKTFRTLWSGQRLFRLNESVSSPKGEINLFVDEFSRFNEVWIAETTLNLLHRLGYHIYIPKQVESGRASISKGMLRRSRKLADRNVLLLQQEVSPNRPLVGIEPSCILSFRDEYPELVSPLLAPMAQALSNNVFTLEEFIVREYEKGNITNAQFTASEASIRFHGHCQQKAITTTSFLKKMLSIPKNYQVREIASGCCGMAGSFGYEKEHYPLSMKIGELVLFPEVRQMCPDEILVAPGTSCRQHIQKGTGRTAIHPAELLFRALID